MLRDTYSPRIIEELNDHYLKVVKIDGNKVPWHSHTDSDELFFVIDGKLTIEEKPDTTYTLNTNDLHIVKKGIEHKVHTESTCLILLVEAKSTKHTGDIESEITKSIDNQLNGLSNK